MSIETTLRTYLLTDSTLTGYISTRLYYSKAFQEQIKPYVVYWTLGDPNVKTLVGHDGGNPIITFRIVAETAAEISGIKEAIRAKIVDFTGTMGTIDVYRINAVNFTDFPPQEDQDFLEHFCDYEVIYERS